MTIISISRKLKKLSNLLEYDYYNKKVCHATFCRKGINDYSYSHCFRKHQLAEFPHGLQLFSCSFYGKDQAASGTKMGFGTDCRFRKELCSCRKNSGYRGETDGKRDNLKIRKTGKTRMKIRNFTVGGN